jgi:hypothetical protein
LWCGALNLSWHKICGAMGEYNNTPNTSEKQQTAGVEKPHLKGS